MQIEIRSQPGPAPGRQMSLTELVTHWLINSLGLLLVSKSIKGIEFHGNGWEEAATIFAAAALLGLVNVLLKPMLLLLTLPINLLSLGLFTLVINAGCLGLVAWLVEGFEVSGFWAALLGAFLLSLISVLLTAVMLVGGFRVKIQK